MSLKVVVLLACIIAVAKAGVAPVAYAAPTITSQASNVLRTPGNLGQISTYQKTIDTPFSSVRKADIRVSNDALAYPAVPAYAAALPARAVAAPAYAAALPGRAVAAPASLLGVAYSPATAVASMTFSGYGIQYAY